MWTFTRFLGVYLRHNTNPKQKPYEISTYTYFSITEPFLLYGKILRAAGAIANAGKHKCD